LQTGAIPLGGGGGKEQISCEVLPPAPRYGYSYGKKWKPYQGRFVKNFVGNAEKACFQRNFLAKTGKFL
jgi:hypothetical protein